MAYHAWLMAGRVAHCALQDAGTEIAAGAFPSFRVIVAQICPPKRALPGDMDSSLGVARAPRDTRPIGLTNCGAKTIAGFGYMQARPHVSRLLYLAQNGLVLGAVFVSNIIHLDAVGRLLAANKRNALPCLVCSDFGVVFPILLHEWVKLVVRFADIPEGLAYLSFACLHGVYASGDTGAGWWFLCPIRCGAIQGRRWPPSASRSVVAGS